MSITNAWGAVHGRVDAKDFCSVLNKCHDVTDVFFVFWSFFRPVVPVEKVSGNALSLQDFIEVDPSVSEDERSGAFNLLDEVLVAAIPVVVFVRHKDTDVLSRFPCKVLFLFVLTSSGRSDCLGYIMLEVLGDEASNSIGH